jgi:integrase
MARRASGDGTVVKRVKNGVTYYVARIQMADGTRREKWFRRKGDADAARRAMVAERDHLGVLASDRMTVEDLIHEWLDVSKGGWSVATYSNAKNYGLNYIVPKLGTTRIRDLSIRDVERFLLWASRDLKRAPRTVRGVREALNMAITYAVSRELLGRNVVSLVRGPKIPREEMVVLTVEQAQALIDYAWGKPGHAVLILMVTTGMRGGEALALRWSDVHWQTGELTIQRGIRQIPDTGRFEVQETKNRSSTRTIVLPSVTLDALRLHQQQQREQRMQAKKWHDPTLIFPNGAGGVGKHHYEIGRHLHAALATIDAPDLHPHGLRHTAVSILLSDGQPVPDVSMQIGHSTPAVTMGIYAHRLPGASGRIAASMGRLFASAEALGKAPALPPNGGKTPGPAREGGNGDGTAAG